jgi:hypothetical protein
VLPQPEIGGRANSSWQESIWTEKKKKEEFPGTMGYMPTGNSFPQICVVSKYILSEPSKSNKGTKGQWILVTKGCAFW